MKKLILLIAALMIVLGLTGVFWPLGITDFAKWSFTSTGLYIAAGIRIVFGLILLIAANKTATPKVVRGIGAILVAAGLATLFLSAETTQRFASSWLENGEDRVRISACLPLLVGLFLAGVTVFRKR
jgi:ABC-type uncharacterized transport system permease subunit